SKEGQAPRAMHEAIRDFTTTNNDLSQPRATGVTYQQMMKAANVLGGVLGQSGPGGVMPIAPALSLIGTHPSIPDTPIALPPRMPIEIRRLHRALDLVLRKGWQGNDRELSKPLDLLFAASWAAHLQKAVNLPPGAFFDLESKTSFVDKVRSSIEFHV